MAQKARAGRPGTATSGSFRSSAGMTMVSDTDRDIGTTAALTPPESPTITEGATHTNALLLGMVYTRLSLMKCKRQLTRDGIRCRAFEQSELSKVFSIDNTHTIDQGEDGRHICQNFTKPSVLGRMDSQWAGLVFRHVIMDYFYTPSTWHEER